MSKSCCHQDESPEENHHRDPEHDHDHDACPDHDHGAGHEEPQSCCAPKEPQSCCGPQEPQSCCSPQKRDWLFWGSFIVVVLAYLTHWLAHNQVMAMEFWGRPVIGMFTHGIYELFNKMWWGLLLGLVLVGLLTKIPREFVMSVLGRGGKTSGLFRATLAGLFLDLCNHGILLVGMQLYRRGASLGQTMAFLIASPWNSLSLTIILISLIGFKWTFTFFLLSGVIALISGWIFERLVERKILPPNPNSFDLPEEFKLIPEAKKGLKATKFDGKFFGDVLKDGLGESRMILRWIFFGTVLAALLRAFIPDDVFASWVGPTIAGLAITLVVATILEVCSEGSSPIAADLILRAQAPGNAFTFLMSGAATDYTEIMALKETTGSWKIALFLPLVTVPQVVLLGWLLNSLS